MPMVVNRNGHGIRFFSAKTREESGVSGIDRGQQTTSVQHDQPVHRRDLTLCACDTYCHRAWRI